MRIQCEVCSATYTIDDEQLTDQPVGAQCPYCGHVKLVNRFGLLDDHPAGETDAGGGFATYSTQQGPPPGYESAAMPDLESTSYGASYRQEDPGAFGTGSLMDAAFDDGAFDPGVQPVSASEFDGLSLPESSDDLARPGPTFGVPRVSGEYSSVGGGMDALPSHEGDASLPSFQTPSSGGATCSTCGKALVTEFDKVIGLCDEHQQPHRHAGGEGLMRPSDAWWVRPRHGGHPEGPSTLEELRDRLRRGELSSTDQVSPDGQQFAAVERFPELAYISVLQSPGAAIPIGGGASGATHAARRTGPSPGKIFKWGVLVGGALLVVMGLYGQRGLLQRIYTNLLEGRVSTKPIGLHPLRSVRNAWGEELGPVEGLEPSALVAEATQAFLQDTWSGYRAADEAYRKALLVDPEDPEALGGYVENLALWRLALVSPEESNRVEATTRYALRLYPESVPVHRAAAAIASELGRLNQCQEHANAAVKGAPEDGRSRLLLATCFLEGNVGLAVREAEEASRQSPELARSTRVLAEAYVRMGRYASAIKILQERLERSPDDAAAILSLARVKNAVGANAEAERLFRSAARRDGDEQRAQMELGELMLEMRRPAEASNAFQSAIQVATPQGARGASIYSGWARAELLHGRPARAAKIADQALGFDRDFLPALVLRGEAALLLGDVELATELGQRALKEGPSEPAALVLSGRAAERMKKPDEGRRALEKAAANDPRDVRLAGILAAHYLRRDQPNQAYVIMTEASSVDPEAAKARSRFSRVALTDVPVVEAIDAFRTSAEERRNAPVAHAAIGIMLYFSGEPEQARDEIRYALRLDDSILPGLVYDAQLALDADQPRAALVAARRILVLERGDPLGHVLRARGFMAVGERERAASEYEAALRANPGFAPATVELAGLRLDTPRWEEAIETLKSAFTIQPTNLRLRQYLLKAGL
ncbi:MAG: tetratricopeptide repeat protein [Myxococcota bacterium]